MNSAVFKTIEKIIKIPFVEDQFEEGAVCFANDEELRADFKLQFTVYDVVNYVYGVVYEFYSKENKIIESISLVKIPYPDNADFFWKYSNIGKKIRLQQTISEIEFHDVTKMNWENI